MKISKQLLTLIVAGTTLAAVTISCEKEKIEKNDDDRIKNEKSEKEPDPCSMCGMG